MAYLSTAVRCTCAKWRNLNEDRKLDPRWIYAHQLHHNLAAGRPPFTVGRLQELAGCSRREAQLVLDEATALKWFTLIPAAAGQPSYYRRPVKAK